MRQDNVVHYPGKTGRKGVGKLAWLLLTFFFIILFVLYLASPWAQVAEISLSGQKTLSEAEILSIAGLKPGLPMWRLNLAEREDKLLANPWISAVRISRVFPNTLAIAIEERKAVAVIAGAGESWIVAGDGVFLTENAGHSLPWVTGLELDQPESGLCLGGQASELALEWIKALQPLSAQVSELNMSAYPAHIVLFTTDGFKALFPSDSDIERRMWDLNALLQELRAEKQKGVIDFRAGEGKAVFSPWSGDAGTDN